MTHLLIKQAAGACLKHELAQQIKKQKLLALNYHSKGEKKTYWVPTIVEP